MDTIALRSENLANLTLHALKNKHISYTLSSSCKFLWIQFTLIFDMVATLEQKPFLRWVFLNGTVTASLLEERDKFLQENNLLFPHKNT